MTRKRRYWINRLRQMEVDRILINIQLEVQEIVSILKYASKGKSHGRLIMSAVQALANHYCECCECVLAVMGDMYCLDYSKQSNRKEFELISFLYQYQGEYNDNQYQYKMQEFVQKLYI